MREPIPPPTPRCCAGMYKHHITLLQRERMIRSAIGAEYLSGFTVPMDIAVTAFENSLFRPLPDIGNGPQTRCSAPGAKE